jgi:hypothetical protein
MLEVEIITQLAHRTPPPIILVKKENASRKQKLRSVVDFRRLNGITVGDS